MYKRQHNISSHGFDGISLETGNTYQFKFVPMGDSPEQLRISLIWPGGQNHKTVEVYSEILYLKKTLVDTGISKYYTWEYIGEKFVTVSERDNYEIIINREGNLLGSVSITIEKLDRSI